MYEDHVFGRISEEIFRMLSGSYEEEVKKLEERISELNEVLGKCHDLNKDRDIRGFVDLIEKYACITELTDEILHELIDRILVQEKEAVDGEIRMRIEVYYRFIGKPGNEHGNYLLAPRISWHRTGNKNGA